MIDDFDDNDGDLLLARAAAEGQAMARRRLAERMLPRVRNMVHYLVFEDPDADDLVQLSLVEILQSIRTFGGRSTLETWADRITVRTCMRALKRRQRERQRNQIIAGTVAGGEGETPPSMKAPPSMAPTRQCPGLSLGVPWR